MQRLFIFLLSLRGFLASAIHVKGGASHKRNPKTSGIKLNNQMVIPKPDGSFEFDASQLSPMSVLSPLSLGYCGADKIAPNFKETPPSKDEEYYTVDKGHKRWLDAKPDTGCGECMEMLSHIIVESDDMRECTDLNNKTSLCMLGRTESLSEARLGDNPDIMLNLQLACRCSKKYDCHLISGKPYMALLNWELDVMMNGPHLKAIGDAMLDVMDGGDQSHADFAPDEGVKTEMGSPDADTMYGLEGLTGQRNAADGRNANHNAGMRGRDLMRDSGDGYVDREKHEFLYKQTAGVIA